MSVLTGMRKRNTSSRGGGFDAETIQAVWEKGRIVLGADPRFKRKDVCGAWIERSAYGDTVDFGSGWEIDHIKPVSSGGTDDLYNLQPLQWQNNRSKGDYESGWTCTVVAKF